VDKYAMTFGTSVEHGTALIVGASQGIGLGFVKHLLNDSRLQQVYGTYRRPETAQGLLALGDQPGLTCLTMDVTQEDTIATAMANIQAATPQLHLVVYCVGVLHEGDMQPEKSLGQLNGDQLVYLFQTNAMGAGLLAKHLLPLLKHGQPSVYAARLPAPLPRTFHQISAARANSHRSHTIRKYVTKPISSMVPSS